MNSHVYLTIYTNIELCSTPETNIMLCVSYIPKREKQKGVFMK